jgi:hypothetical protein
MSLQVDCMITCNFTHEYEEPPCSRSRTQANVSATWNYKTNTWDIDYPDGWHVNGEKHYCPKCWASITRR